MVKRGAWYLTQDEEASNQNQPGTASSTASRSIDYLGKDDIAIWIKQHPDQLDLLESSTKSNAYFSQGKKDVENDNAEGEMLGKNEDIANYPELVDQLDDILPRTQKKKKFSHQEAEVEELAFTEGNINGRRGSTSLNRNGGSRLVVEGGTAASSPVQGTPHPSRAPLPPPRSLPMCVKKAATATLMPHDDLTVSAPASLTATVLNDTPPQHTHPALVAPAPALRVAVANPKENYIPVGPAPRTPPLVLRVPASHNSSAVVPHIPHPTPAAPTKVHRNDNANIGSEQLRQTLPANQPPQNSPSDPDSVPRGATEGRGIEEPAAGGCEGQVPRGMWRKITEFIQKKFGNFKEECKKEIKEECKEETTTEVLTLMGTNFSHLGKRRAQQKKRRT